MAVGQYGSRDYTTLPQFKRGAPMHSHITPALIAELEAKIDRLSTSRWFGCMTRQGLEEALAEVNTRGKAIVYFDVDNLKQANTRWGKLESSRRIREAITNRYDDIIIGQFFSGDEFVALVPMHDAHGYAVRIQSRLRAREMSATFYITPCTDDSPILDQIEAAEAVVSAMKDVGRRGQIMAHN